MRQEFAGQHFDTIDDLCMDVEAFLGRPSVDFLQTGFQEWVWRLRLSRESGEEYSE
jgi:hypothetical protein